MCEVLHGVDTRHALGRWVFTNSVRVWVDIKAARSSMYRGSRLTKSSWPLAHSEGREGGRDTEETAGCALNCGSHSRCHALSKVWASWRDVKGRIQSRGDWGWLQRGRWRGAQVKRAHCNDWPLEFWQQKNQEPGNRLESENKVESHVEMLALPSSNSLLTSGYQ